MRAVHDDLADRLSPMLTTRLRNPLRLSVSSIEMVAGSALVEAAAVPSTVAVCDLSPLTQPCALRLPLATTLVIIDLLLGGSGTPTDTERLPTDIEIQILRRLLEHCIRSIDTAWAPICALTTSITLVGTQPEVVGSLPLTEPFLRVDLAMELDGTAHQIDLWMPTGALAGALRSVESSAPVVVSPSVTPNQTRQALGNVLAEVPVRANVVFPSVPMTPAAILGLEPGDLITLGPTDQPLPLRVGPVEFGSVRPARNGTRTACQVISTLQHRPMSAPVQ